MELYIIDYQKYIQKLIDIEKPAISYNLQKIIAIDTTIDSEYINSINLITDNMSNLCAF